METPSLNALPSKERINQCLSSYQEQVHGGTAQSEMERQTHTVELVAKLHPRPVKVCDVATFGAIDPALRELLGINDITTTGFPSATAARELVFHDHSGVARHQFVHDRFDIEEAFPYSDGAFDLVVFTEVLEHLTRDPMHTLAEINRITRDGGWLMLSTPNCVSLRSVLNALRGGHPYVWSPFSRAGHRDRHNREYTPAEVRCLLTSAGYEIRDLHCQSVYEIATSRVRSFAKQLVGMLLAGFRHLASGGTRAGWNGDTIFAVAQKTSGIKKRHPDFLYY